MNCASLWRRLDIDYGLGEDAWSVTRESQYDARIPAHLVVGLIPPHYGFPLAGFLLVSPCHLARQVLCQLIIGLL